jgi:hypothetical protein
MPLSTIFLYNNCSFEGREKHLGSAQTAILLIMYVEALYNNHAPFRIDSFIEFVSAFSN